ncbi:MAG: hypothetical protein ACLU84_06800 [Clostridia bacterium]
MKNKLEQEWKEKTRLENRTKTMITFHIIMIIFSTITAIVEKDFTWILCALLWGNIAIIEYCDAKLLKGKDVLYDLQEDLIEKQNEMMTNLLKDLATPNIVIETNLIKIPKKFTKPNKIKLRNRLEYYNKNKYFEVPIIIDEGNTLVDGYTSYLIAKRYNLKTVQAKVKIGANANGR